MRLLVSFILVFARHRDQSLAHRTTPRLASHSISSMKHHLILLSAFLILHSAFAAQPNVILILVDDMGYECIGANGGTSYQTPVIDKLAASGVRFEHCYVQPLCTPTRVQLMTGIYNVRNYLTFGDMDKKAVTFANLLKPAGYATCMTGKWQLGRDPELPKQFGFDENCLWQHLRRPERYKNAGLEINGVEHDYTNGEYGPDIVNNYALDFISRKKDAPFFLYYPMILTHDPYDATPDSPDYNDGMKTKKQERNDPEVQAIRQRHFAEMVAYADKLTGKLVAKLDELRLRENTLILIVGDNGTGKGTVSMMGDKKVVGDKGAMNHRGMHVPLIVNWPAKAAAGKVSPDLVDSTDFLPTICEAAGVTLPADLKIDGHSFLPQVRGEVGQPREWYYSWYAPYEVVEAEFAATHDFKLYRNGRFFDLRTDREEQQPLKAASLKDDAVTAMKLLQGALDHFKDARSAAIAKPLAEGKKGKGKKKKGAEEQ
jgi:arylsulfatase A